VVAPVSTAQDELHRRVGAELREAFGELVQEAPAPHEPAYFVALGRVGVRVEVEAVGSENALIETYSWIAQQLTVDDRFAAFLVRRNAGMRFSALCVDGEGAIILRQALFPEQLSKAVLVRLIELMSSTADTIDQELRERFA
jgi:hypothetical protein